MVKSLVSIVIASLIMVSAGIFEQKFVKKEFADFEIAVSSVLEKAENNTATKDDMLALRENWLNRKSYLHIFIPHNEIKEFELWISEAISFSEFEDKKELVDKLEVVLSLSREIPKTFLISLENIM